MPLLFLRRSGNVGDSVLLSGNSQSIVSAGPTTSSPLFCGNWPRMFVPRMCLCPGDSVSYLRERRGFFLRGGFDSRPKKL